MLPVRQRLLLVCAAPVALVLAYLAAWPTPIDPQAWQPPVPGPDEGNERLRAIERIGGADLVGPEYVEFDAAGRLYTGYAGGQLMRFAADGGEAHAIANTGGRPVGLRVLRDGTLIVADATRGLLRVAPDGTVELLADQHAGLRFGLTDDVAVSADEAFAYFTDASHKFGLGATLLDVLEHGANGRLLQIDLRSRETTLLLDRLHFANGVVLGPGEQYLLVCETTSYRVLRYWLAGPRAGEDEVFADNLPGFPDNVTFNGRDRYWLALFNPRNAILDRVAPYPSLRKLIARLPEWSRPQPVRHARAIALDLDGQVVADLQYRGADAYAPVTTVRETGDWLYFGSLEQRAIGRLPLDKSP